MTLSIAFLFLLLAGMILVFLTEALPVDLTAFVGLLLLVFAGYVPVADAFDGFSSPAVITMLSIFFVSASLLHTGVADWAGARIVRVTGGREVPVLVLLMLVAGAMSAFMNNVAAAAVLLPASASVARTAGISPSRLFMPLSFGTILGGTTTLVGTPPNILTGEVITRHGLEPLSLFDFLPIGAILLVVGIVYMATIGRRLLPERLPARRVAAQARLADTYGLEERLTALRIPEGSPLAGHALREAGLGAVLDVAVVAVKRRGSTLLAPGPELRLRVGDIVLVDAPEDDLERLLALRDLEARPAAAGEAGEHPAIVGQIRGLVARLPEGSGGVGRTVRELELRERYGVLLVGIRRGRDLIRQDLAAQVLRRDDDLLVLGAADAVATLEEQRGLDVVREMPVDELLHEHAFVLHVPEGSDLAGSTVRDSRLGEVAGLTVLAVARAADGALRLAVPGDDAIRAGDELLVAGEPTLVDALLDLGPLEIEDAGPRERLESSRVRLVEAVVTPRSRAIGRTLRGLHFRDHYGLQVLSIQQQGEPAHSELADRTLDVGDVLLAHGPVDAIDALSDDGDFVLLGAAGRPVRRAHKAWAALGALALMIVLVITDLAPVHLASFVAAVAVVLFGAVRIEEAYRAVEWRALFLVAAILPVGTAMQTSGAAALVADTVAVVGERFGPIAFLALVVVLGNILSQTLDSSPTIVILAPVVLLTAESLDISPYPPLLAVSFAASAGFMTPFSQKANLLVFSAGGYRAVDFVRVGTPLTVLVLLLIIVLVPWFFPL